MDQAPFVSDDEVAENGMVEAPSTWRRIVEALPIASILAVAALARGWQLEQNGFGREYYAAGVRSMLESWHNVIFNAFDPAGFVSLDKPPLAIWLQAASAKVLGFSGISVLLPQVLAGLVSICLLYRLIDASFGRASALLAAMAFALTPVSIAVDRSNNTESLLIALLLVATMLGIRAALSAHLPWYCAAMAVAGLGFNVKMGAALILAPVLALTFSLANRASTLLWHMSRHLAAGLVLTVVSLAWVTAFDLVPPSSRPYAGSSRSNSMLELALVHNGAARFGFIPRTPVRDGAAKSEEAHSEVPPRSAPALADTSLPGPFRLFRPRQAAQAGWLLPLAILGVVLAFQTAVRDCQSRRAMLTAAALLAWLLLYWGVLSAAGGIVHTYYLAVLVPPLATFAGIGLGAIWTRRHEGSICTGLLPAIALGVVCWQGYLFAGQLDFALHGRLPALFAASACMTVCSVLIAMRWSWNGTVGAAVAALGLLGVLAMPVLAASSIVLTRPNVVAPYADIARLAANNDAGADATRARVRAAARKKLLAFLAANQGAAKYLVAVPNAVVAAPLIIEIGRPVLAMGGYLGDDPILTSALLQKLSRSGELRYVMLGGFTLAPERQQAAMAEIDRWIRANGSVVDERLWRLGPSRGRSPYRIWLGDTLVEVPEPILYDLR